MDDPLIGRVLDGRYRIEMVLGAGGVGVVYRAEHTGLRRPVALKVLRHGFEDFPHMRKRFEREARVLSQLSHPNVVGLTDYGIADDLPYLVMELLEGRTLEELLEEEGPPAPERSLEIVRAVVRGLAFAHDRGVLHRDLKPGNVFLQALPDDPDHVKLLDFGLAKILVDEDEGSGEEPTLTKTGTIVGTPAYMSPEQASGSRVDPRSDVYACGVLLFELLAGRVPFRESRRADLLRAHLVEPVPDPEGFRPGLVLARELQELLLRCLAKEPAERFADGRALLDALDALPPGVARFEAARARETTEPTRRSLADARAVLAPSRKRSWGPVGLVAALALGIVGAYFASRTTNDTSATGERSVGSAEASAGSSSADPSEAAAPSADETPAVARSETRSETRSEASLEDDEADDVEAVAARGASPFVPSRDPFELPMSPELGELADALHRATSLDRNLHRRLRVHQRQNPTDPRPSLLLAHDLANRGQWVGAIQRYGLAYHYDPSARNDPRMLEDLLRAAQIEAHAPAARQAILSIFGAAVRPRVEELYQRTEHRPTRLLLGALRDELAD